MECLKFRNSGVHLFCSSHEKSFLQITQLQSSGICLLFSEVNCWDSPDVSSVYLLFIQGEVMTHYSELSPHDLAMTSLWDMACGLSISAPIFCQSYRLGGGPAVRGDT